MDKNERLEFLVVEMEISKKYPHHNGMWDVRFDEKIIQYIETPYFNFSAIDNVSALDKVMEIVSRHPEDYFCSIRIRR